MLGGTILDVPQPEQEWMPAELRRARYGDSPALHVLLLCAAWQMPTEPLTLVSHSYAA